MSIQSTPLYRQLPFALVDFVEEKVLQSTRRGIEDIRFSKNRECKSPKEYVRGLSGRMLINHDTKEVFLTYIFPAQKPLYKDEKTSIKSSKTFLLSLDASESLVCEGEYQTRFKRTHIDKVEKDHLETIRDGVLIHEELDENYPGTVAKPPLYFRHYSVRKGSRASVIKLESVQKAYRTTLRDLFKSSSPTKSKLAELLKVCYETVSALKEIHEKYLHGDVRPENILIADAPDKTIHGRLSDFKQASLGEAHCLPERNRYWDVIRQRIGYKTAFSDVFGVMISVGEAIWGKPFSDLVSVRVGLRIRFQNFVQTKLTNVEHDKTPSDAPPAHFYKRAAKLIDRLFEQDDLRWERFRKYYFDEAPFEAEDQQFLASHSISLDELAIQLDSLLTCLK